MQWGQGCFYWDFLLHYQTAVVILEDRTNYLQELLDFFSGTEKLVIKIHLACEQLLWARHTARCFPAPVKNLIALKLQIYGHEHTCTCRCWHSKECILILKWGNSFSEQCYDQGQRTCQWLRSISNLYYHAPCSFIMNIWWLANLYLMHSTHLHIHYNSSLLPF